MELAKIMPFVFYLAPQRADMYLFVFHNANNIIHIAGRARKI